MRWMMPNVVLARLPDNRVRAAEPSEEAIRHILFGEENLAERFIVLDIGKGEDRLIDHQEVVSERPLRRHQGRTADTQEFHGHAAAAMTNRASRIGDRVGLVGVNVGVGEANQGVELLPGLGEHADAELFRE